MNILAAFYQGGCADCDSLKEAFTELGTQFGEAGLVKVVAMNCGKHAGHCKAERSQPGPDRPKVVYYGVDVKKSYDGSLAFKDISSWLARIMSDLTSPLLHEAAVRKWVVANDTVPKVVFFTSRKTTPPLIKALSIEFRHRAALAVVTSQSQPQVARLFGATDMPAMLRVDDEDTLDGTWFSRAFKKDDLSYFLSLSIGRHRASAGSGLRELNSERFDGGDCAPSDGKFCLLAYTAADAAEADIKPVLKKLAQKFHRDPVKVFFVRHTGFMRGFGDLAPGAVLLYRPKRKRFKVFDGDVQSLEDLAAFVDGAVAGGSQLPQALRATPTMRRDEL